LYVFTLTAAFFVTRAKKNVLLQRRYSHEVDKSTGVHSDHTVVLTAIQSIKAYPDTLRRVTYVDPETHKRFRFLTNNFALPALTIAKIYKSRWQVELFFKWIKQHLRIKAFYGTSENAVKTQIWIAVSVYVLVAIIRKRLDLDASLYQILQIFSVNLFEKTPIFQVFQEGFSQTDPPLNSNQLILFELQPDSSDMATVGEGGWPYIQHRGGTKGFVKVIDDHTIAFADLRGNKQYITTGNLMTDDRVALIFVDYPRRTRLKLIGHSQTIEGKDASPWLPKLDHHDGVIERVFVIRIEASDWNCPQHITPRFTEDEIRDALAPWTERIEALEKENNELRRQLHLPEGSAVNGASRSS
jgi:predicted pyridoxine 5'-phosphate oxidase superfamily flavin-nucleotide-binding protein